MRVFILSTPILEGHEYDLEELRLRMEKYELNTYYAEMEQSICYVSVEEFVDEAFEARIY